MKRLPHFHVRTELAKYSISLALTAVDKKAGGTLMQDDEGKKKEQASQRNTERELWSKGGNLSRGTSIKIVRANERS